MPVLVYAYRRDTPRHGPLRAWLERALAGPEPLGLADGVLAGFLRTVTHPRLFDPPAPMGEAMGFVDVLLGAPGVVEVRPGERHRSIFKELCLGAGARGGLVGCAWLAALAIESGGEWITTDRGYGRFPGLRWRVPS